MPRVRCFECSEVIAVQDVGACVRCPTCGTIIKPVAPKAPVAPPLVPPPAPPEPVEVRNEVAELRREVERLQQPQRQGQPRDQYSAFTVILMTVGGCLLAMLVLTFAFKALLDNAPPPAPREDGPGAAGKPPLRYIDMSPDQCYSLFGTPDNDYKRVLAKDITIRRLEYNRASVAIVFVLKRQGGWQITSFQDFDQETLDPGEAARRLPRR
jgi:hypothetical protein